MSRINKYHLLILMLLWSVVHLILFEYYGIRDLYDATENLKRADLFSYHWMEDFRHIFYTVPFLLISLFHFISPNSVTPFIIFQCVLSGLATISLYVSSWKIFNSSVAGLISAVIFLLWVDNLHWDITLMTESLLCSFTLFLIYLLSEFDGTKGSYFKCLLLMVLIFFTRPTGVIGAIGGIAFLLRYNWPLISAKPILKYGLLFCLLLIFCISAYVMFSYWDFTDQYKRGNIVTFVDTLGEGSKFDVESLRVIESNIDFAADSKHPIIKMAHFIFYNPIYFIKTGSLKVWYLVSTIRPYYSVTHNVMALLWVSVVYILFVWGFKNSSNAPIKFFISTIVIVNCSLIAISTVDWDNRFYIPMEPGIVLLTGGGASAIWRMLLRKATPH
jgi:hypothetical protein